MKAGNNSMKDFFVKEPKFSILIAVIAIILLLTLFLTMDFNAIPSFSYFSQLEFKFPKLYIPSHINCGVF